MLHARLRADARVAPPGRASRSRACDPYAPGEASRRRVMTHAPGDRSLTDMRSLMEEGWAEDQNRYG